MARSKISSIDSPSSSGATATDEKERARQIITQLNGKSVNPSLFIRYASFPGQNSLGFALNDPFVLGPIFFYHCPQELVDIFLILKFFNLYINIKMPFGVLVILKLSSNHGPSQNLIGSLG